MPWRIETVKNSSLRLAVSVFISGLAVACVGAGPVSAVDSQIGVSVCGTNAPPAVIEITQPISDSVVDQATTTFRGTISNASQIEVEVDSQYSTTVAIGMNDTTFQFDVAVQQGTHTVTMNASAVCGGQDGNDSVVITYQPAVEPSSGGMTPTTVEGAVTLDGEPVITEALGNGDNPMITTLPLIGPVAGVVSDFMTAIGLDSTLKSGDEPVIAGVARVGVTVAALTSIVMASTLAPMAIQAVPGISEVFNVSSHRSMIYLGWVIRGTGVLAMALAYFL